MRSRPAPRRTRRGRLEVVGLPDAFEGPYGDEIRRAAVRAKTVGAVEPLEYLGMGMEGIVFLDAKGLAFKVGRRKSLLEEAEFLRLASRTKVAKYVPKFVGYDPHANVLVRKAVLAEDVPFFRRDEERRLAFDAIAKTMRRAHFRAPEFKEDSFVWNGKNMVMVDLGFGRRIGARYVRHVERVLAGIEPRDESWADMAWGVRMDALDGKVARERARRVLAELVARDPKAAEWASGI